MQHETQPLTAKDAAETFTKAALRMADEMIVNIHGQDPELAAKVAEALDRGEHLVISLTLNPAPLIELATKDYTGSLKRCGSIQMQPRAFH